VIWCCAWIAFLKGFLKRINATNDKSSPWFVGHQFLPDVHSPFCEIWRGDSIALEQYVSGVNSSACDSKTQSITVRVTRAWFSTVHFLPLFYTEKLYDDGETDFTDYKCSWVLGFLLSATFVFQWLGTTHIGFSETMKDPTSRKYMSESEWVSEQKNMPMTNVLKNSNAMERQSGTENKFMLQKLEDLTLRK
jgi:hypothetical protein